MPLINSINSNQIKTFKANLPLATKTNGRKIQKISSKEKIPFRTKSHGLLTWQKVVVFGLIFSAALIPPAATIAFVLNRNGKAEVTNKNEVQGNWTTEALKEKGLKFLNATVAGLNTLWDMNTQCRKKLAPIKEMFVNPTTDKIRHMLALGLLTFVYLKYEDPSWDWFTR